MTFWERMEALTQSNGFWIAIVSAVGSGGWWVARTLLTNKARIDALEKTQERMLGRLDAIHDHLLSKKD